MNSIQALALLAKLLKMKLVALLLLTGWTTSAFAQRGPMPDAEYYQIPFVNYYQGDYRQAIRNFISAEKGAYKMGNQRFLDSVCYWTMIGECHYQVGNYTQAIAFYEQAITLYLGYLGNNWQSMIQPLPAIARDNGAVNRTRITWGTSERTFIIPKLPQTMSVMFGELDAERRLQQGGVLQNAEFRSVDVNEIMRCTALAIYRRNLILGPTSKFSQLSNQMVAALRAAPRAGLLGAYNGVLLGLAQASIDDWNTAAQTLGTALQFNNGMDHPLTALALLQLAQIGVANQEYEVTFKFAMEASYTGALFGQYDVVDDSLSLASQMYLMQNSSPFTPLSLAIEWARRDKIYRLHTSLAIRLAESLGEIGQTSQATAALALTDHNNARGPLSTSQLGGRARFVRALNLFQSGNFSGGTTELDAAIKTYRPCSLWIYRLALTDTLTAAGGIAERQADLLYASLLRDPNAADWQRDPLESITFLATDHLLPLERWFEVALARGDNERALEIAELTRRHRFFSQLPFGGRTLAFRWLIHAPAESLSGAAQQQRRDFLVKFPNYQTWINRTDQIQTALSLLPVLPDAKSEQAREQVKLYKEYADISVKQESFLANCGLRRIPAEMSFPPQPPLSDFRTKLAQDQAALVWFATVRGYHRFLVRAQQVQYLGLLKDRDVQTSVRDVLKKLGVSETSIDVALLQKQDWQESIKKCGDQFLAGVPVAELLKLRELVIVPDGLAWYFPFEAIPLVIEGQSDHLSNKLELRYSPTLFLAYDGQRTQRELKHKAVVLGKPHSKAEAALSQTAFMELAIKLPKTIKIESLTKSIRPEFLGTQLDQISVWGELETGRGSVLEKPPIDLGSSAAPLRNWMLLPHRSPDELLFPAFQSDAGTGLRGKQRGADMFLFSLGVFGTGTRSMLLSRWRTGGTNNLAFSKLYLEKLESMSSAKALRESVNACRQLELNYATEPQLRAKSNDPVLKADHPYFWAGYLRMEIPLARPADAATATEAQKAGLAPEAVPKAVSATIKPEANAKPAEAHQPQVKGTCNPLQPPDDKGGQPSATSGHKSDQPDSKQRGPIQ
jgi:tetratricopeptide (TPR) repeat protein